MRHIKYLKELFDKLPMDDSNYALYSSLLYLDISDFKPIMEAILDGRIDIEDIRPILQSKIIHELMDFYEVEGYEHRLSRNENQLVSNMTSNLLKRVNGGKNIIKENISRFLNTSDMKRKIADVYKRETGKELTSHQINSILPIVESRFVMELNLDNLGGFPNKDLQLLFSDILSSKPRILLKEYHG